MRPRVVIVGGGLAGLVVAHALRDRAYITIVEKAGEVGGRIRTDLFDGFLVEAGPDSFLTTKPHALELCHALGISNEIEGTIPRRTRGLIVRNGRLHPLPEGLSGLIPARLGPLLKTGLLSPGGRARFLAEWFVPPTPVGDDESIASFIRRRFGDEAWQWLIEPLLGGIHGGDGEQLSLRATFPALADAERRAGSVLTGLREKRPRRPTRMGPFVAPRGGMRRLIDALVSRINADIVTDATIGSIERHGARWIITVGELRIECDATVLAVPANAAATLLEPIDAALAATLAAIPFASTTVVNVAYDAAGLGTDLDGYGYLNPPASGRDVIACTWTSSKFANRAPPGGVLLRCFLRGEHWASAASDGDVIGVCTEELLHTLRIVAEPRWARVTRWPDAMPQYTLGHLDRLRSMDAALEAHRSLFLTGNSYRGTGIPDTIAHARFVAKRLLERFEAAPQRSAARGSASDEAS